MKPIPKRIPLILLFLGLLLGSLIGSEVTSYNDNWLIHNLRENLWDSHLQIDGLTKNISKINQEYNHRIDNMLWAINDLNSTIHNQKIEIDALHQSQAELKSRLVEPNLFNYIENITKTIASEHVYVRDTDDPIHHFDCTDFTMADVEELSKLYDNLEPYPLSGIYECSNISNPIRSYHTVTIMLIPIESVFGTIISPEDWNRCYSAMGSKGYG